MRVIALVKWWGTIPGSYNALSAEDQKTLIAEKNKKKVEFDKPSGAGKGPDF